VPLLLGVAVEVCRGEDRSHTGQGEGLGRVDPVDPTSRERAAHEAGVQHARPVTPIRVATNTPERPIRVASFPFAIAITPNGRTAYVLDLGGVTPISTATNRAAGGSRSAAIPRSWPSRRTARPSTWSATTAP
jgi:hypothetical protein